MKLMSYVLFVKYGKDVTFLLAQLKEMCATILSEKNRSRLAKETGRKCSKDLLKMFELDGPKRLSDVRHN